MKPISISEPSCAICLEDIIAAPSRDRQKEKRLLCGHLFHETCIGEWLERSDTCPLCRARVTAPNHGFVGASDAVFRAVEGVLSLFVETSFYNLCFRV